MVTSPNRPSSPFFFCITSEKQTKEANERNVSQRGEERKGPEEEAGGAGESLPVEEIVVEKM